MSLVVYYFIVIAFMFALPLGSVLVETAFQGAPLTVALAGKWFVFWAMGWRLLLAGVKQIAQPSYTAREILGLKSDDALILVRELGFANVAMGVLGVASLFVPAWQGAAALSGAVFYGLAGVNHLFHRQRNRLQNVAMLTDLFAAAVLCGFCVSIS